MNNTNKVVFSNLIWRLMERFGAQIVTFVVSIILARILDPNVYGKIALVTVVITILQVFVDGGLGNALIQKKEADDLDFSTVFYFNVILCVFIYFLLFFVAGYVAAFFDSSELTTVIRVLGLTIIISGVKNVQQAYVSRNMLFKRFFFATLGGTVGAAVIGISLALLGYGVWALVAQHIFNLVIDTLVLWLTVKWRPKKCFSFERLKVLFRYGWKLLLSSLIAVTYENVRSLIIGKRYSLENLAFYNRGNQFPEIIVTNINSSIDSVLLPSLSKEQLDRERVKSMTRRAIKTSTYIMMPMMVGLAVCAEPIVTLLLTDKWLPAVFFLRIFCICYAFYPIHTANLNAIKAIGRSDYYLVLEIIKKTLGILVIVITMFISVEAIAYGVLAMSFVSQLINSWPNKKLLAYGYFEQIKDMLPQIIISMIMGFLVYLVSFIPILNWTRLLIQVLVGIISYLSLSIAFKLDSFQYVVDTMKSFLTKKQ